MNRLQGSTRLLWLAALVLLISPLILTVVNGGTSQAVYAQASSNASLPRTITVLGEGKVKIKPDIARTNIGVEVLKPTVAEARKANKEIVDAIFAALKEQGIAEKDIQTSGFSVYAERFGANGPLPEDKVSYRVSNSVTINVRDLDKVGEVLDAAIKAGANNIYGIDFSLADPKPVLAEARKSASADAKVKAEQLAQINGVKVGRIISISEMGSGGGAPYPVPVTNVGFSNSAVGAGGPQIAPGELDVTTNLQVVFEIAE